MKYIDAEKLKAEIERRRLSNRYIDTEDYENELLEIIDSLQKEQPELPDDLDEAAEEYEDWVESYSQSDFPTCVSFRQAFKAGAEWVARQIKQEQSEPICKTCGFYENNCPFISGTFKPYPNKVCKDYIYSVMREQEQPEVDLKNEYKEYVEDDPVFSKLTNRNAGLAIARHFYELGLKAVKEDNNGQLG